MSDINEPFDWAWAEREESAAALKNALASFYEDDPLLELLWACSTVESVNTDSFLFDSEELTSLRAPTGFPVLFERCDILQACCQNPELQSAQAWLDWSLKTAPFSQDQLSCALSQGCWQGWFLGERSILAERLLDAGADTEKSTFSGDTPLISLFRAVDEPSPSHFAGATSTVCEALLRAGAKASKRNRAGESALSRINLRLGETLIGMADEVASEDYMRCAQLLLDNGADAASVREAPPLELVVPHPGLRGMIQGCVERSAIGEFLGDSQARPPALSSSASRSKNSSRL